MLLFVFWLRNRPSIKCVRNWRDGRGSCKMCTGAYRCKGVSISMFTYALTDNYSFNAFVLRFLVHTFIKKGGVFYIFESPQKTGIRFSSTNFLHNYLLKIPLWHKIPNASSYFIISTKNLKWKQHFHNDKF